MFSSRVATTISWENPVKDAYHLTNTPGKLLQKKNMEKYVYMIMSQAALFKMTENLKTIVNPIIGGETWHKILNKYDYVAIKEVCN